MDLPSDVESLHHGVDRDHPHTSSLLFDVLVLFLKNIDSSDFGLLSSPTSRPRLLLLGRLGSLCDVGLLLFGALGSWLLSLFKVRSRSSDEGTMRLMDLLVKIFIY